MSQYYGCLFYVPIYPSDWLLSSGIEHQLKQILITYSENVQANAEVVVSFRSGVYITPRLFYGALIIPSREVA